MKEIPQPKEPPEETSDNTEKGKEVAANKEGVIIPEEFQQRVHDLVHKAPKPHLEHIRSRVSMREDEIRKQEDEDRAKKRGKTPETFTDEAMPS